MRRPRREYYPAIYWFAMLRIPDKSLFPGTGPEGNGMPVAFKSQEQWLNAVQLNGCGNCHQLGDKATREMPAAAGPVRRARWRRGRGGCSPGPGGGTMVEDDRDAQHVGRGTRRGVWRSGPIASAPASCPASVPPRPHGVERNLVVTVYDWLSPKYYIHDLIVTDRRKPTVNAFGLIYGAAELSTDRPADPRPDQDRRRPRCGCRSAIRTPPARRWRTRWWRRRRTSARSRCGTRG